MNTVGLFQKEPDNFYCLTLVNDDSLKEVYLLTWQKVSKFSIKFYKVIIRHQVKRSVKIYVADIKRFASNSHNLLLFNS